jgi:hypothetical protein
MPTRRGTVRAGHDSDEGFLRRVLGILRAQQHTKRDPVQGLLQRPHDLRDGMGVAVSGEADERRTDVHELPSHVLDA